VSRAESRYERADFLRADNALQLVETLARQIDDPELLSTLLSRITSIAEAVAYRSTRGSS
jgi:hypothetical protein